MVAIADPHRFEFPQQILQTTDLRQEVRLNRKVKLIFLVVIFAPAGGMIGFIHRHAMKGEAIDHDGSAGAVGQQITCNKVTPRQQIQRAPPPVCPRGYRRYKRQVIKAIRSKERFAYFHCEWERAVSGIIGQLLSNLFHTAERSKRFPARWPLRGVFFRGTDQAMPGRIFLSLIDDGVLWWFDPKHWAADTGARPACAYSRR